MANVKISGLPAASAVVNTNEFEINEAGTSKKVTGSQISAYVQSQLSVDLTTDVTGTLPVANGGTGATTLTANNVLLGNGTSAPLTVAPGTSGNVLTSNGTTWASSQLSTIAQGNSSVAVTDTGSNGTVAITTEGTERMRITSGGIVGIGTTGPRGLFEVKGGDRSVVIESDANGNVINLYNGTTQEVAFGNFNGEAYLGTSANQPIAFFTSGVQQMRLTGDGEVWIGATTDQGAFNLQCNGTGVWGAGAYVNGSDERIKDDIEPIVSGLDVVEKLNPVTYRYKESWTKDQSVQTGFIAQELLTALEDQIYVDGVVQQGGSEGYYSVAYQNLIPILTKAIQEQQAIIEALTARIEAVENA